MVGTGDGSGVGCGHTVVVKNALVPTDLVILGFQSIQINGQSKKAYEPILVVLDGMVIDVSAVALAKA